MEFINKVNILVCWKEVCQINPQNFIYKNYVTNLKGGNLQISNMVWIFIFHNEKRHLGDLCYSQWIQVEARVSFYLHLSSNLSSPFSLSLIPCFAYKGERRGKMREVEIKNARCSRKEQTAWWYVSPLWKRHNFWVLGP